jgi:hypothetical protein
MTGSSPHPQRIAQESNFRVGQFSGSGEMAAKPGIGGARRISDVISKIIEKLVSKTSISGY